MFCGAVAWTRCLVEALVVAEGPAAGALSTGMLLNSVAVQLFWGGIGRGIL